MEWKNLIRKHETWLETYYALAKFTGWLLIFFGLFNFVGGSYLTLTGKLEHKHFFYGVLIMPFTNALLPGLLALVVAGFLRYLLNPEDRVGFFLAHGDKVLYLAAAVYSTQILYYMLFSFPRMYVNPGWIAFLNVTLMGAAPNLLLWIAKILIAVGLAQGLRRMLSMINESKTLV